MYRCKVLDLLNEGAVLIEPIFSIDYTKKILLETLFFEMKDHLI
jgi:hypothetical protein